ncbi:hypothetical protein [Streptomyces sp. AC154]
MTTWVSERDSTRQPLAIRWLTAQSRIRARRRASGGRPSAD